MQRVEHLSRGLVNCFWNLFSPPKPATSHQEGTFIDNILNPSHTHEEFIPEPNKKYDFGIGLDYFSDLGHQTMNSDIGHDTQWLIHSTAISNSLGKQILAKGGRGIYDCPLHHLPSQIPADIKRLGPPLPHSDGKSYTWEDLPLYTNLCLGTLPIMIHHNGNKDDRDSKWNQLWLSSHMRTLWDLARLRTGEATLDEPLTSPKVGRAGDSWIFNGPKKKGEWLPWGEICADSDLGGLSASDV